MKYISTIILSFVLSLFLPTYVLADVPNQNGKPIINNENPTDPGINENEDPTDPGYKENETPTDHSISTDNIPSNTGEASDFNNDIPIIHNTYDK
jgi:hypothetical protein